MASFELKVEDSSPLISYAPDGAWPDTSATDALTASYSGRSLHTTSTQGATATIQFNGTGISIFGGRRSNYGTFSITIDGETITSGDAKSAGQDASFNQLLGSALSLANGPHTAVLTNTGGAPIDIDWVDIKSQVGSPNSKMSATTFDDSDSRINYLPATSAWGVNTNPGFMNNTLHFTDTPGASASFSFSGDAVAVYGTMSPDHANVRITVDGRATSFTGGSNGFVSGLRPQVLLYYANNLGSEPHVLTMASDPQQGTGPFMDLDAITVFSADTPVNNNPSNPTSSNPTPSGSPAGSTTSGKSTPRPSSSNSKSSSKTPIIGGVIAGVIGLILILVLVFLFLRRRRRRGGINKRDIRAPTSPMTPDLPMQGESMMEAGFARVTPIATFHPSSFPPPPPAPAPVMKRESVARHSIAPSYYSDPSYASDAGAPSRTSSLRSSAALMPKSPRTPPSARLASPRGSPRSMGSAMNVNGSPRRPNRRPPPLDIPQ